MEHMVKWLRLRDPYLLSTLVSLLCKILRRLGQFDMEIENSALQEVESLGKGGLGHYKVTPQQRAELRSAWEDHFGFKIIEKPTSLNRSKDGILDSRLQSKLAAKHEHSTSSGRGTSSSSSISDDMRSLSKSLEQGRSTLELMRSRQDAKISGNLNSKSAPTLAQSIKESREKAKEEKRKRDAAYLAKVRALRGPAALVPGEGSGLKGIGVQGKDHGPQSKEQGVMVSSDEESEDDGTEVKAFLTTNTERSKKVSEQEQSLKRSLNQQPQGPVRKKKIVRSAHDMRARLVPNMDMLHLTILRWDIFHEGDVPPGDISFHEVSNTFQTPQEYYNTFYPLLVVEAWRSLSTAKDENNFKPFEIKVVNRLSVDSFFEVGTTMSSAANRDNNLAEGDIVLLSKGQDPMRDRKDALCLSRIYRITRKKDAIEISYRISGQTTGNSTLLSAFSPNLKIRGVKLTSMTTIEREYAALKSLEFYDLCDEILSAKPSPLLSYPAQMLEQIRANYGVNLGQAKAIWSAMDNDAFTLVQG
jgi:senataxin